MLPQAVQAMDVDDLSITVLDRTAQVSLIGQSSDDAEQNNTINPAPVSGEGN
jgi:hypothetical protein